MARCSPMRAIWTAIARCCLAGTTPPRPAEPTSPPARPPYGTRSIPRSWTGSTARKRFGWPPLNDWKRPGADAMDPTFLITAFVTLFVIIDPVGMTPLFVALTQGMDAARRRAIALRACITAALILIVFAAFGEAVLGFVGISMPAFRIAGGILLFLTALDMLFERRTKRRQGQADEAEEDDDSDDPSVFPLAIPLIAGPGAIATVILLAGQRPGLEGLGWVIGVMLSVILLVFLLFLTAGLLEHALGRTGINVVTRLLGMLLAALAVQFVLDGLRGFGLAG